MVLANIIERKVFTGTETLFTNNLLTFGSNFTGFLLPSITSNVSPACGAPDKPSTLTGVELPA